MRKNPNAVALGKLGGKATKGVPKRYSPEELAKRTERIRAWNNSRKPKQ